MTCIETIEMLTRAAEAIAANREPTIAEAAAVKAHCINCPRCAAVLDRLYEEIIKLITSPEDRAIATDAAYWEQKIQADPEAVAVIRKAMEKK